MHLRRRETSTNTVFANNLEKWLLNPLSRETAFSKRLPGWGHFYICNKEIEINFKITPVSELSIYNTCKT
jgi:hypothetical protein